MSNMFRGRAGPLAAVGVGASVLLYQTFGGAKEFRSRADKPAEEQAPVGETMSAIAGTGGKKTTEAGPQKNEVDPKDTRIPSQSPDVTSKRSGQKTLTENTAARGRE
jgi:hypothetical protein